MKGSQPSILNDELLESHNSSGDQEVSLSSKIKLMNKNEYTKCRRVEAVIRYRTPNKVKEPELYSIIYSCCICHGEMKINFFGHNQTYASKFYEASIQEIIERNRAMFEPDAVQ